MVDKDCFYLFTEVVEQGVDEGSLAGTNLSGKSDKTFPLVDPIDHGGKCLPVGRRQKEKLGIRSEIKRVF